MAKVVYFNIPASGHVNPSLPVIAEMVRRGETVLYINTEEMRRQIETTGAQFVPYPSNPQLETLMAAASGGSIMGNALALANIGAELMPWVLALLEREQPQLVLFDSLAAWGKQAAEHLSIRSACIITTLVITPQAMPVTPAVVIDMVGQALPRFPAYWAIALKAWRRYGVKPVGLLGTLTGTGDLNIIFTSRHFQPSADSFDAGYHFVGPALASRPRDNDFPFEQLTGSPRIYISLGTINNANLAFYRACFEAFADHPGQFILSAGKRTDLAQLAPIPPNFLVRNFVPQLDVLQQVDLFITHGGMNSVHEGLYYGVPLVVVPQQAEQAIVARRTAALGAGVALAAVPPYGSVTAAELRRAVDEVLGKRAAYQAQAAAIGESFRTAGGAARAAEVLMAYGRGEQH
jgi:MGT family glycosyltransferase